MCRDETTRCVDETRGWGSEFAPSPFRERLAIFSLRKRANIPEKIDRCVASPFDDMWLLGDYNRNGCDF